MALDTAHAWPWEERRRLGLSRAELARRAGVHRDTVRAIEDEGQVARERTSFAIGEALRMREWEVATDGAQPVAPAR